MWLWQQAVAPARLPSGTRQEMAARPPRSRYAGPWDTPIARRQGGDSPCQAGSQSNHPLDGGEEGGAPESPAAQRARQGARPVDPVADVLAGEQEQIQPRPGGKYPAHWKGAKGTQRARFEGIGHGYATESEPLTQFLLDDRRRQPGGPMAIERRIDGPRDGLLSRMPSSA